MYSVLSQQIQLQTCHIVVGAVPIGFTVFKWIFYWFQDKDVGRSLLKLCIIYMLNLTKGNLYNIRAAGTLFNCQQHILWHTTPIKKTMGQFVILIAAESLSSTGFDNPTLVLK